MAFKTLKIQCDSKRNQQIGSDSVRCQKFMVVHVNPFDVFHCSCIAQLKSSGDL